MLIEAYRWFFMRLADVVGIGWGIVALSVITSAAMMPLMKLVAGIVRREADYQSVILPQIEGIKSRYSSDAERHVRIQRLYARYGYSPLSAVKKVFPLFVQIPFLLLTYFMLKDTVELRGVPFLFLRDLGEPDGLIRFFGVNLLPLVMTGVNLLTVAATPGFTRKDQMQAVGISLLFLVLLYAAPSALLLYWTLNNVITMVRTLFGGRFGGGKLLLRRMIALRTLPMSLWRCLTPERLDWISVGLLLTSVYMWLMVFKQVWFFNCYISGFLASPVLFAAIGVAALSDMRRGARFRTLSLVVFVASAVMAVFLLSATALIIAAPSVMRAVGKYVDLVELYQVVLVLYVAARLATRAFKKSSWTELASCLRGESHWLMAPLALAMHYSVASDFVKLPVDAMLMLAVYMLVPCVAIPSVVALAFGRGLPNTAHMFRAVMGFCIGGYLVPMISIESGKLTSYQSNLVLRLLLMFVVALLMLRLKNRKTTTTFLSIVLLLAGINAAFVHLRKGEEASSVENREVGEAERAFLSAKAIRHNSVYLLVYDAYEHDLAMDDIGIRKYSRIQEILSKRGFTRYNAYSVGSDTVVSMGNSFAIGDVQQGSVRSMMAGNNPLCDFLRRSGYKTSYALCAYDMPARGERMPGDFYFPSPKKVTRFENVIWGCILRGYLSQSPNTFNSYTEEDWNDVKRRLVAEAPAERSFVYAHNPLPGHLAASAVGRKSAEEELRAYVKRMQAADRHIEEDVDAILAKKDDSIIIVASDHGALIKWCERGDFGRMDILDRCGVQLYVRWPNGYVPTLDMDCLSDVFLEVFICLSGDPAFARFEAEGTTEPIQAPLKAPRGAVRKGIIRIGRDAGKPLLQCSSGDKP